jgi:hypothetical protein
MKLSGWVRLWIVGSALYMGGVVSYAFVERPRPESTLHSAAIYAALPTEMQRNFVDARPATADRQTLIDEALKRGLVESIQMPNGHSIVLSKDESENEKTAIAQAYWASVEAATNQRVVGFVIACVLWWLVPVLLVFALGWSIRWVYGGFKG